MGLRENLSKDTVVELSLRKAIIVDGAQTIREAVLAMREGQLGCVILVNEVGKPTGIFTEAMLRRLMTDNHAAIADPVSNHAATSFPWVQTSDSVETVLEAMDAKNHRFVVVVDDAGSVVGLTGQKGLMEYVAEHFPREVMVQRVGQDPYPASREGA
jgi:CBS domain-containing protein